MQTKPKTPTSAAATVDVAMVAQAIAKQPSKVIWETIYLTQGTQAFTTIRPGFLEANYEYKMTIPCEAGRDSRITGFVRAIEGTTFTKSDIYFETRVGILFKTPDGKSLLQIYLDDSCTLGYFNKQSLDIKGPFTKWLKDRIRRSFDW